MSAKVQTTYEMLGGISGGSRNGEIRSGRCRRKRHVGYPERRISCLQYRDKVLIGLVVLLYTPPGLIVGHAFGLTASHHGIGYRFASTSGRIGEDRLSRQRF